MRTIFYNLQHIYLLTLILYFACSPGTQLSTVGEVPDDRGRAEEADPAQISIGIGHLDKRTAKEPLAVKAFPIDLIIKRLLDRLSMADSGNGKLHLYLK